MIVDLHDLDDRHLKDGEDYEAAEFNHEGEDILYGRAAIVVAITDARYHSTDPVRWVDYQVCVAHIFKIVVIERPGHRALLEVNEVVTAHENPQAPQVVQQDQDVAGSLESAQHRLTVLFVAIAEIDAKQGPQRQHHRAKVGKSEKFERNKFGVKEAGQLRNCRYNVEDELAFYIVNRHDKHILTFLGIEEKSAKYI